MGKSFNKRQPPWFGSVADGRDREKMKEGEHKKRRDHNSSTWNNITYAY